MCHQQSDRQRTEHNRAHGSRFLALLTLRRNTFAISYFFYSDEDMLASRDVVKHTTVDMHVFRNGEGAFIFAPLYSTLSSVAMCIVCRSWHVRYVFLFPHIH